jgi:hypothetical protein
MSKQGELENTLFDEYGEFNDSFDDFIESYNDDYPFGHEGGDVESQSYSEPSKYSGLIDLAKHAEMKRQERRRLYVEEREGLKKKPNPNDLLQLKKYMSYILTSKIVDLVNHPYLLADPK